MKLLTDLNLKDKITLVMVTHELALKAFAERVVWMRDGKIQTVENVPVKKRRDAFARLEEDFKALKLDRRMFSTGSEGEDDDFDLGSINAEYELGAAASASSSTPSTALPFDEPTENVKSIKFMNTEIRQPTDYQQIKMIYGMKAEKHKEKERIAAAATLAAATKKKPRTTKGGSHTVSHHAKKTSKGKEKEDQNQFEADDQPVHEGKLVDIPDSTSQSTIPSDLLN